MESYSDFKNVICNTEGNFLFDKKIADNAELECYEANRKLLEDLKKQIEIEYQTAKEPLIQQLNQLNNKRDHLLYRIGNLRAKMNAWIAQYKNEIQKMRDNIIINDKRIEHETKNRQ